MNKYSFVIDGELPTMNQIIAASKKHHMVYANMKKDYTALVQISAAGLPKIERADFGITWYCKNKRSDKDNRIAGQKFIFDGLVKAGILANDGWKEIGNITHKFAVDKEKPRIEITIQEVDE